jgi:cytochrome c2
MFYLQRNISILLSVINVFFYSTNHSFAQIKNDKKQSAPLIQTDEEWLKKCSLMQQNQYKFSAKELEELQQQQKQTIIYPNNTNNITSANDWSSLPKTANSVNGKKLVATCANCHALPDNDYSSAKSNMGPSLVYLRNILIQKETAALYQYVYEKIYNAKAFHLCSAMPRFGAKKVLKPEEITDIISYLFAPNNGDNQNNSSNKNSSNNSNTEKSNNLK